MSAKNEFLKKRDEWDKKFYMAGMETGVQLVHDFVQVALRDPETMGKDVFGRARIERLFRKVKECDDYFHLAFTKHNEADKRQEELDDLLREIWGEDTAPFDKRYPYARQYGYEKPQKGWVD